MGSAFKGELPKKQRIVDAIRESIMDGELVPGVRLATVRELSEQFEISTAVVHRALREMATDGLLESRANAGFYVCDVKTKDEEFPVNMHRKKGKKVFLSCGHHSDLTWKYPYAEYDAIREKQWDRISVFFEKYPAFCAFVEQSAAIETYLAVHPEKVPLFQKMATDKRLSLTGGFTIPDLNMIGGELIVRNLQYGKAWYRNVFGIEVTIACMNDAFGMCGQLPQILKKSNYDFLYPGRMPGLPENISASAPFAWCGVDESSILVIPVNGVINHYGRETNVPVLYSAAEELRNTIHAVKNTQKSNNLFVQYITEESLLREELFPLLENANRLPDGWKIEFGSVVDYTKRLNGEKLPIYSGEFNPVFSGCYTTRITVKQNMRASENLMFAAELASALGDFEYDFSNGWRELLLTSFHDAVCGCHHDAVSQELTGKFRKIKEICGEALSKLSDGTPDAVTILNPDVSQGWKIVEFTSTDDFRIDDFPVQRVGQQLIFALPLKGGSLTTLSCQKAAMAPMRPVNENFETEFFQVDFSSSYPKIRSKVEGCEKLFGDGFGEILFRHERGTMWSETFGSPCKGREAQKERLVLLESGDVFIRAVTEGEVLPCKGIDGALENHWSGFGKLKFQKEYRFYHKLDSFSLRLWLDFEGMNTKVMVAFPLNIDVLQSNCVYDVPFGTMNRAPYFEVKSKYASTMQTFPASIFRHAAGDYPAQHYVDYGDCNGALTVANDGVAGWQLNNGVIQGSLLRSGNGIMDGNMQPQRGAYDNGCHEYEFEFRPHRAFEMEKAAECGRRINRKALIFSGKAVDEKSISSGAANVIVSSVRRVADGWVVRLYETLGRITDCELQCSVAPACVYESDLQECEWHESNMKIHFEPMEIKTLKLIF